MVGRGDAPTVGPEKICLSARICYTSRKGSFCEAKRPAFVCLEMTNGVLSPVEVQVRDNNVDQALRALKKKMQREGLYREMRLRRHYAQPSEKRAREKAEAVRRARKLARKTAQREGLLPAKGASRARAGAARRR